MQPASVPSDLGPAGSWDVEGFQDPLYSGHPRRSKPGGGISSPRLVLDKLTRRAGPWGLAWSSGEDRSAVGRGVCGGERPRGTGRTAVWDAVWAAPRITRGKGEPGLCVHCPEGKAPHRPGGSPASPQALCPQQKQGGRCTCEGTNVSRFSVSPGQRRHRASPRKGNVIGSGCGDQGTDSQSRDFRAGLGGFPLFTVRMRTQKGGPCHRRRRRAERRACPLGKHLRHAGPVP